MAEALRPRSRGYGPRAAVFLDGAVAEVLVGVVGEHDSGERVHPELVEVIREVRVDPADRRPQKPTGEPANRADVVVTAGCGDECPHVPGKRHLDRELEDPKGAPLEGCVPPRRPHGHEEAGRVAERLRGVRRLPNAYPELARA